MTERITAVVGGFDALATALAPVPAFSSVISINSTSELQALITSDRIPNKKDTTSVVFIFADTMRVDTPQDLPFLVERLTASQWRVLIVEVSPAASEIVRANPSAGFLTGPFRINEVLYAISNLGTAAGLIPPYENSGQLIIVPTVDWANPTSTVEATPNQVAQSGWKTATDTPPAPTPPAPTPPAPTPPAPTPPTPPAPAPPTPTPPAPAPPAPNPWPTPAPAPPAPPAPNHWPTPAPDPWSAPPAPTPAPSPWTNQPPPSPRPAPPRPMAAPVTYMPQVSPVAPRIDSNPGYIAANRSGRRAKVIVLASPKGGTGKSTLTLNLAVYLALRMRNYGKRVCVIDANFQQADAGKLLDHYSPNIVNVARDRSAINPEQIEQFLIHRPDYNLSALLGPAVPEEANPQLFTGALYSAILEALRPNFDYIFIDTPVAEKFHDIFSNFALPQADYIIVPITPAYHTVMNVDGWLSGIIQPTSANGAGIDPNIVGIVLNQHRENVGITEADIQEELYQWKYLGSIPDTNEWVRAINSNELIATKNIHELNTAFSRILYAATGEEEMLYGIDLAPQSSKRRGLRGLFGR